jgi:serine/threonine protein kinase
MLAISTNVSEFEIKNDLANLISINNIKKISPNDITYSKLIGEGAQSKVYEGYYLRHHCSIKVLKNIDYKSFMSELVIMAHLSHPTIPKFYGIVYNNNNISIITEFIKGDTLNNKLPELDFNTKLNILKDIANVLEYMHVNHIIHRDLKPENIILDKSNKPYLIDYGISKICANKKNVMTNTKGTLYYLAPESFEVKHFTENEEVISIVSDKVDVWAFGCLISYIFSGEIPWEKYLNEKKGKYFSSIHYFKNLINQIDFPIPNTILHLKEICELIKLCTIIDENRRISMTKVNDILFKYLLEHQEERKATFAEKYY